MQAEQTPALGGNRRPASKRVSRSESGDDDDDYIPPPTPERSASKRSGQKRKSVSRRTRVSHSEETSEEDYTPTAPPRQPRPKRVPRQAQAQGENIIVRPPTASSPAKHNIRARKRTSASKRTPGSTGLLPPPHVLQQQAKTCTGNSHDCDDEEPLPVVKLEPTSDEIVYEAALPPAPARHHLATKFPTQRPAAAHSPARPPVAAQSPAQRPATPQSQTRRQVATSSPVIDLTTITGGLSARLLPPAQTSSSLRAPAAAPRPASVPNLKTEENEQATTNTTRKSEIELELERIALQKKEVDLRLELLHMAKRVGRRTP